MRQAGPEEVQLKSLRHTVIHIRCVRLHGKRYKRVPKCVHAWALSPQLKKISNATTKEIKLLRDFHPHEAAH